MEPIAQHVFAVRALASLSDTSHVVVSIMLRCVSFHVLSFIAECRRPQRKLR